MTLLAQIRARVRAALSETLARNTNKEVFTQVMEAMVADGVKAGLKMALQLLNNIEPPNSGVTFLHSYEEGYKQCLSDLKMLLEDEAKEA
jgi:hypothetical protein